MRVHPINAALLACSLLGAACTTPPTTSPEAVGEIRAGSGILNGYLPRADLPDSLALVAPPPAAGSPQALADENAFRNTVALRNSPRSPHPPRPLSPPPSDHAAPKPTARTPANG